MFVCNVGNEGRKVRAGLYGGKEPCSEVSHAADATSDKAALMAAVRATFRDVPSAELDVFLQIKDEEWGGAFVELRDDQAVPDKAVVQVVILQKYHEVCTSIYEVMHSVSLIFVFQQRQTPHTCFQPNLPQESSEEVHTVCLTLGN